MNAVSCDNYLCNVSWFGLFNLKIKNIVKNVYFKLTLFTMSTTTVLIQTIGIGITRYLLACSGKAAPISLCGAPMDLTNHRKSVANCLSYRSAN